MYISSPTKKIVLSNFLASPLASHALFKYPFYLIPTLLSIIFCLVALGEIIHIIWNHFHPNKSWE